MTLGSGQWTLGNGQCQIDIGELIKNQGLKTGKRTIDNIQFKELKISYVQWTKNNGENITPTVSEIFGPFNCVV